MLSLTGRNEIIRNVYKLARAHNEPGDLTDLHDLRSAYLSVLRRRQPKVPINFDADPFIDDPALEEQLAQAFRVRVSLDDMHEGGIVGDSYDDTVRASRIGRGRRMLQTLREQAPDHGFLFGLTVHSVFFKASSDNSKTAHGGTSSGAIGTIWLTTRDSVSDSDIMEMYVHELTHTLLFVDELNHPQFDYAAIAKPENFARSSILLRQRPLDKVIHSIIVATEVLVARRDFLGEGDHLTIHPPTPTLAQNALRAAESVYDLPNIKDLMSARLLGFVQQCESICKTFAPMQLEVAQ